MHDEAIRPDLDEPRLLQRGDDRREVVVEQAYKSIVRDVSRRDDEQSPRCLSEKMTVAEVPVLRDDDAVFGIGERGDLGIGAAAAVW